MNLLDILLIIIVLIQASYWARAGFIRSLFSIVGFWAGFIGGILLVPPVLNGLGLDDPALQIVIAIAIVFGSGAIVGSIGKLIGQRADYLTHRLRLGWFNSLLGAVTGAGITLLGAWLIASMFSGIPYQGINAQLRQSAILQSMNETLPPAPAVLSGIGALISQEGFPQVFIGPEPRPIDPVDEPSTAEVEAAAAAALDATVRIEGYGCGGIITGSGFVVADDLIATNAHVVAGISTPIIVDRAGQHESSVIYFDPAQDIAILRSSGLAGDPLTLSGRIRERGTAAAALGYPGGEGFSGSPAGILRHIEARGFDIYGKRPVTRSMYELQAEIRSGHSGGPLVLPDGTVIGILVSRSASSQDIGYAIVADEVSRALEHAQANPDTVDTQSCVR